MKLKTGDKVKFLNDVGGGIIVGYQSSNIVLVRTSDGFEIPTLTTDVIPIIDEAPEAKKAAKPDTAVIEDSTVKPSPLQFAYERRGGENLALYLAFVPYDTDEGEKMIEAYLINDSNFYFSYVLMRMENASAHVRHQAVIEPNAKTFLEEFPLTEVGQWEHVRIQGFATKQRKPFRPKDAVDVKLRIEGSKFYKPGTFRSSDFFDEPALIFDIYRE